MVQRNTIDFEANCGHVSTFVPPHLTLPQSLKTSVLEIMRSSNVSYLSHDVCLTAGVTVLLQSTRVAHSSDAVCHLAGRVADRQAALEVYCQLSQALWDEIAINNQTVYNITYRNQCHNNIIKVFVVLKIMDFVSHISNYYYN